MVKSKINVDADKRFHLRITQWSYPICDSWTSTSIRHWLLASQPTSKEYCTVCLWEIFNIILYFPVDCLFRVKTITLETANVTNCHVIATDILFLSSNHRSVQFLYLAASPSSCAAIFFICWRRLALACWIVKASLPEVNQFTGICFRVVRIVLKITFLGLRYPGQRPECPSLSYHGSCEHLLNEILWYPE